MKIPVSSQDDRGMNAVERFRSGLTLVELLLAVGVGSILIATTLAVGIYSARSFSIIGNFADMDADSRQAIDALNRELHPASAVTGCASNPTSTWLTFTTNVPYGPTTARLTWDSQARTLTLSAHGYDRILLTECDYWEAKLYKSSASPTPTNISLVEASDPFDCKLIKMSWRCSRTNQGTKLNTESLQRLQFVLQNRFNYLD
jgi:hypothetical protein